MRAALREHLDGSPVQIAFGGAIIRKEDPAGSVDSQRSLAAATVTSVPTTCTVFREPSYAFLTDPIALSGLP